MGNVVVLAVSMTHITISGDTVTVVAIVAAAVATIALAFFNWSVVRENRQLVRAAQEEARASADLVRETQRDRELGARPYITFTRARNFVRSNVSAPNQIQAVVRNIGRGPAITCQYHADYLGADFELVRGSDGVEREVPVLRHYTSDIFDLGPGKNHDVALSAATSSIGSAAGGFAIPKLNRPIGGPPDVESRAETSG